ncbi:MAG TPA: hypothetical protein VF519_01625 [Mycobacteriales bacterium]|jgi:hypothetical protein
MSRSLRRLVAGALAAAALTAMAPQSHASVQCYRVQVAGRYYYFCV